MITTPSGTQKVTVHGVGPQAETMSVAQFRDAAGYSKQTPLPPREVTASGIVTLAGSTVTIKTTGFLNGNRIEGLAATDGLVGASVATEGLPEGVKVASIVVPATPSVDGVVSLSNVEPFAPATGVRQPVVFTLIARESAIAGLAATDGLAGARVSGGSIPEGATVREVRTPAVAATNTRPGSPGEVVLALPVRNPDGTYARDAAKPVAPAVGAPVPVPPAVPVPPPAAVPDRVDLKFSIPTERVVFPDGVSRLLLSPPEPLPALTVLLPEHPVDGHLAFIYSTLEIGELTVLAHRNQSLHWSPTLPKKEKAESTHDKPPFLKLPADSGVGYLYSAPDATWDRIQ